MPLPKSSQEEIQKYCESHLPKEDWYEEEFDFIQDYDFKKRIIEEFQSVRYAYKLYEGLEATDIHLRFQIRSQILSYASIYEAVLEYVLNTYYSDTPEYEDLTHQDNVPTNICIPQDKRERLQAELSHDGKEIYTVYYKRKKKQNTSIRFDDKCRTAENLNLIGKIHREDSVIDLPAEIIEIYSYRNGIHLIAEQRKEIKYELELGKLAYRRLKPFIEQIKNRLKIDGKYYQ